MSSTRVQIASQMMPGLVRHEDYDTTFSRWRAGCAPADIAKRALEYADALTAAANAQLEMASREDTASGKKKLIRGMLEISDGSFLWPDDVFSAHAPELRKQAIAAIKRDIKSAIWGLSPIFGEHDVLAWCREIIEEDRDASGPQTSKADEVDDA